MNLYTWGMRWRVPNAAMQELTELFGISSNLNPNNISEAAIQQQIRLRASQQGARLWRNNVGVMFNDVGVPVRFGLCNESAAMNKQMKSSDLIGITPIVITSQYVGQTLGVFTAYEVKRGDWSYKGNKREIAQLNFIQLVSTMGGIARFINNAGDL